MKKGFLIVVSLFIAGMMMAQDVDSLVLAQDADTVRIKGIHPWDLEQNKHGVQEKIAHWSIIPHIGFNSFDGDFPHLIKHTVAVPTAGLALEYNFTPVWTIGVQYMYDMYTVTGKGKQISADTLLYGHMHKAGGYLAMDLINLFFPRAHKKIFSLIPFVGAGGAWYQRSKYYLDDKYYDASKDKWINPTHGRDNTWNTDPFTGYTNAHGKQAPEHDKKYHMIGYLQAGVDFDFNLNRTLALGIRADYTYFTRDYVDGRGYHKLADGSFASKNNDGIFDVTLYMRFKLEAVSKSHPRNMTSFNEFDKLLAAQDAQPATNAMVVAPHDTVIIYRHDSIIVRESMGYHKKNARVYNVYFDNDKSDLREDARTKIFEASQVLEEDDALYAVVIGYCDNTASKAHNYKLGEDRAKNVTQELNEEYAIPMDHIYNAGIGKIAARKSNQSFGPNRRVSIHLVDKETFELMKLELQDKEDTKNTDENVPVTIENSSAVRIPNLEKEEAQATDSVKTVALSESARKEQINQYKQRKHETIVTEKGVTLAKLARQYYDNTMCWVYIYMANSDVLPAPSALQEGQQIIIPELTQEELKTTMAECLRLYSITAHQNAAK